MAGPDLELRRWGGGGGGGGRGGGGGGRSCMIFLPCWSFSLQSFLLFLPKIRGGGGIVIILTFYFGNKAGFIFALFLEIIIRDSVTCRDFVV